MLAHTVRRGALEVGTRPSCGRMVLWSYGLTPVSTNVCDARVTDAEPIGSPITLGFVPRTKPKEAAVRMRDSPSRSLGPLTSAQ